MELRLPRHAMLAGGTSLALHGALLMLLLLVGLHAQAPDVVLLPPIELQAPELVPISSVPGPSGEGTLAGAGNTPKAGAIGRRGHDAPKRSFTKAPAVADPYADVVIGYDAPDTADPGSAAGALIGTGLGISIEGTGIGNGAGFGHFGDGPGMPAPSAARPPRPKHAYTHEKLKAVRTYAGQRVVVGLIIDPQGRVRKVGILHGVTADIDRQAIALARTFEFQPALRDDGQPRWGSYRWDFIIEYPPPDEVDQLPPPEPSRSILWHERR